MIIYQISGSELYLIQITLIQYLDYQAFKIKKPQLKKWGFLSL